MDNMNTNEPNITPPSAALLARWTLNPVQAAFLATDARFSFYVGGVGAGKTTAGSLRALAEAKLPCRALAAANAIRPGIQTINRLLARREDGTRGLYVSPRCVHTLAEYASYLADASAARGQP